MRDPAPPPAQSRPRFHRAAARPRPPAATRDAPGAPRRCPVPCSPPSATRHGQRPPTAPPLPATATGPGAAGPAPSPQPGPTSPHHHGNAPTAPRAAATPPPPPPRRRRQTRTWRAPAKLGSARLGPTFPPSRGCRPLTRQLQRPGQHRSHAGDAECACAPLLPHRAFPRPAGSCSSAAWGPPHPPTRRGPRCRIAPRPRGLTLLGQRERGVGGSPGVPCHGELRVRAARWVGERRGV